MSLWQCHELDLVPLTLDLYGGSAILTLASWIVRLSGPWFSKGLNLLIFSSWLLHDNFMTTSGWLKDDSESPQWSLRALRKHSESTQRALREHSESTQRALREHSESTQRATGTGDWDWGMGNGKGAMETESTPVQGDDSIISWATNNPQLLPRRSSLTTKCL